MTTSGDPKKLSTSPGSTVGGQGFVDSLLVEKIKNRWQEGEVPDAQKTLAEHPELLRFRSVVLDLALEEYLCRQAAGEDMNAAEFAGRFPGWQRSLYMLIEVQQLFGRDSAWGNSAKDILWPEPGESFLDFMIVAELGRGTFGRVFLATEPALSNRQVAIKIAPHGGEAEILGKLRHPNIVPVYSAKQDKQTGLTVICMPYLGRATLLDVVDRLSHTACSPRKAAILSEIVFAANDAESQSPVASCDPMLRRGAFVDAVIHLGVQLANALAFTHAQGICHGDLKPSNVLLSWEGRPLLLDFNLSRDKEVAPKQIGGTLPYMAPEQLQAIASDSVVSLTADKASDIYSLGVILYEILAGTLPYGLPSKKGSIDVLAADLWAKQQARPPYLRERNPYVDHALAALIEKCLAFEPNDRPATAGELASSLALLLTSPRRWQRLAARHPGRTSLAGAIVVSCGILGGAWLALRDPYPVRVFRDGQNDYRQGQATSAIEKFNNALLYLPENQDFLLARAKAYHSMGKFREAFEDYQKVYRTAPSGELAELEGYCLTKLKSFDEAIDKYQQALRHGRESLSVWNNLGFVYMQQGRLAEAESCMRKALALDPGAAVPRRLAVVAMLRGAQQGKAIPSDARAIIGELLTLAPSSKDAWYEASLLESYLIKDDPDVISQVIGHLRRAVALGLDPKLLAEEPRFQALRNDPALEEALTEQVVPQTERKIDFLVDPL